MVATLARIPPMPAREDGEDDLSLIRRAAALGPLARDRFGIVFTFRLADLDDLLTRPETRQLEVEALALQGVHDGPLYDLIAHSLLFSNEPRHKARRTPLARTFAFPLMAAMRPAVRAEAEALIAPLVGREADFLADVAGPLPARIVARILGLPAADIPAFTKAVYSAARGFSVRRPEVMAEATADTGRLWAYVDALLAARAADPQDDFLTEYLARVGESDLDAKEIRAQIVTVIMAGTDTTRMALTMTLAEMLMRPGVWEAFVADPAGLAPGAVAEGLRLNPVVGSLARVATAPFEIAGYRIAEGTILAPLLIAALRDPDVYAGPDRFDMGRTDAPRLHPVFGAGPHRCLGEALARIEMEEALRAMAALPGLRMVGPPPTLRGLGAVRGILGELRLRF